MAGGVRTMRFLSWEKLFSDKSKNILQRLKCFELQEIYRMSEKNTDSQTNVNFEDGNVRIQQTEVIERLEGQDMNVTKAAFQLSQVDRSASLKLCSSKINQQAEIQDLHVTTHSKKESKQSIIPLSLLSIVRNFVQSQLSDDTNKEQFLTQILTDPSHCQRSDSSVVKADEESYLQTFDDTINEQTEGGKSCLEMLQQGIKCADTDKKIMDDKDPSIVEISSLFTEKDDDIQMSANRRESVDELSCEDSGFLDTSLLEKSSTELTQTATETIPKPEEIQIPVSSSKDSQSCLSLSLKTQTTDNYLVVRAEESEPCQMFICDERGSSLRNINRLQKHQFYEHDIEKVKKRKKAKKAVEKKVVKKKKTKVLVVEEEEDEEKKEKKVVPNYFVSIQITNKKIHNSLREVQESVVTEKEGLKEALVPLPTLHITVIVVYLSNKDEITRAKQALEESIDMLQPLYVSELLELTIKRIGDFNKKVVFAEIDPGDQLDELHTIADVTEHCFSKHSINITDKRGFKPHLTIMKLSNVRQPWKKGIKYIDPKYYEDHAEKFFGKQRVFGLQLCAMNKKKQESGYYQVTHQCDFAPADPKSGQVTPLLSLSEALVSQTIYNSVDQLKRESNIDDLEQNKEDRIRKQILKRRILKTSNQFKMDIERGTLDTDISSENISQESMQQYPEDSDGVQLVDNDKNISQERKLSEIEESSEKNELVELSCSIEADIMEKDKSGEVKEQFYLHDSTETGITIKEMSNEQDKRVSMKSNEIDSAERHKSSGETEHFEHYASEDMDRAQKDERSEHSKRLHMSDSSETDSVEKLKRCEKIEQVECQTSSEMNIAENDATLEHT